MNAFSTLGIADLDAPVELDEFGSEPIPNRLDHDGSAWHGLRWPAGYRLTADGLFYTKDSEDEDIRLSGPFSVLGLARDPSGNGWAVAIEWRDRDDSPRRGFVAFADLLGDGYDAFRPLVSGGLALSHDTKLLKAAFSG